MTTAVATHDEPILASQPQQAYVDPTGGRLVAWASGLSAAHHIARALCETSFAPQHFKNKPEEAAAAILFGDEIGLTPTQALRSIHVISGTPGLYARTMVALVMSKGHEVWTIEKTDTRVKVGGRRLGSSHVVEETWTLDRAKKAGYTKNAKYNTDPQAMLYARCAADVCRQIAPDALAGLAFSVEEIGLQDELEDDTEPKPIAKRRTAQRAPLAAVPVEEPSLDETPETPEELAAEAATGQQPDTDGAGADLITAAQMKKLHAQMNEAGYKDRDDGLRFLSLQTGREVESSKDLSVDEASSVIDFLESGGLDEPPLDVSP